MWPNDLPGLGVDIDEVEAAKYPWATGDSAKDPRWVPGMMGSARRKDGSVVYP